MLLRKSAISKCTVFVSLVLLFLTALTGCPGNDPGLDPINAAAPNITVQPSGGAWDVSAADSFSATVTAASTDEGTLSYQWYSNTSASAEGGTPLEGKMEATLTLAKADYTANNDYYFYVVVTNTLSDNGDGGTKTAMVTSNAITVTVNGNIGINAAAPVITAQPTGGIWELDTAASFAMTVTAASTDSGTLSYQWYSNTSASTTGGTLLDGKTEATLTLEKAGYSTDDYYFYVVVTNTLSDNGDGGTKTASLSSNAVTVAVTTYVEAPQSVKDALTGTWVEPLSTYTIGADTFQTGTMAGGYGGTIEKVRVKSGSVDEGYITIQYTFNDTYENAVGRYYVIHFQNLTDSGMDISGAFKGDDPDFGSSGYGGGKETAEAAEAAFTVSNGSFENHTAVTRIGGGDLETPVPAGLINTWQGEDDGMGYYIMEITDGLVTLTYTMSPEWGMPPSDYFTATIVNVRYLSPASGYITLYYDQNQAGVNTNKYGVLYYQDLEAGASVNMVVAANSASGWGGSSKDTAEEAESTYVWTHDTEIDGGGYLVNNNGNDNAVLVAFTPEE